MKSSVVFFRTWILVLAAGSALLHAADPITVTLTLAPGLSLVGFPVLVGTNRIAELLPSVPEGTLLYKFDARVQDHIVNQFQFGAWADPTQRIVPGEGVFWFNPGPFLLLKITGTTPAGLPFPALRRGFNLVSEPGQGQPRLPSPRDGDGLYRWDPASQSYAEHAYVDGLGWLPPLSNFAVGEAFFYLTPFGSPPDSVPAGGTILFSNYLPGLDLTGLLRGSDGYPLAGRYFYQLLAGPSPNLLTPIGSPVPGGTGPAAGSFFGGTRVVPDLPAGSEAFTKVLVWDALVPTPDEALSQGLLYGESAPGSVILGGVRTPPPGLPQPMRALDLSLQIIGANVPPISLSRGSPRIFTARGAPSDGLSELCGSPLLDLDLLPIRGDNDGEAIVVARGAQGSRAILGLWTTTIFQISSGNVVHCSQPLPQGGQALRFAFSAGAPRYLLGVGTRTGEPVDHDIEYWFGAPPQAQPDNFLIQPGVAASVVTTGAGVLENDVEPDGFPLEAVLVQPPARGSLALGRDGSFVYRSNSPRAPEPDTFSYRATDGILDSPVTVVRLLVPRLSVQRPAGRGLPESLTIVHDPPAVRWVIEGSTNLKTWSELDRVGSGSPVPLARLRPPGPFATAPAVYYRARYAP